MRFFLTTVCLFLSTFFSVLAQTQPSWQWGRRGGSNASNENEAIKDIATDPNGNVYILSQVRYVSGGSATLDVAGNAVVGKGSRDVLLSSFTCTGAYRWSKVFGGISTDAPGHLETDTLGGVYLTARLISFNNTVELASDTTFAAMSAKIMYLIKYDTAGNYKWAVRPQSDTTVIGDNSNSLGLQVDGGGNVYWLAHLYPNTYGNGAYAVSTYSLNVLEYDKNGAFQGGIPMDIVANTSPSYYQELFFTRNHNNGRFYLSGYARAFPTSTLSFGSTNITNAMFIGAFSSLGTSLWTRQNNFPGIGRFLSEVTLDSTGNLYVSGAVQPGDAFAGSPAYVNGLSSLSGMNLAMSLDSSGNLRWSKNTSNVYVVSQSHGTYVNGEFVLAGSYTSNIKWAGLNDSATKVVGGGDFGFYTTRFNAGTGQPLSMDKLSSINLTNLFVDVAQADKKGNVYFGGQMDRGVVIAGDSLRSAGSSRSDFFLAKYGYGNCNCVAPIASIVQSNINNTARSAAFQYTGTTAGIDSIVFVWDNGLRLRLTNNFNGVITQYYGTNKDTFNVCVTAYTNGCGNNTACTVVRFGPVGVGQLGTAGSGATMVLAPNPATNVVQVAYSLLGTAGTLEVYDLAGRLLSTKVLRQRAGTETVGLTEFAAGVYVVVLREEGRVMQQQRLVISK